MAIFKHAQKAEGSKMTTEKDVVDLAQEAMIKSIVTKPAEPEIGAEVGLFYVKEIRWLAINKTLLDNQIPRKLKEYFQSRGAIRSNYSNVILVNQIL